MKASEAQKFTGNGYICRILDDYGVCIESYTDPYEDIELNDGVTLIIPDSIKNYPVREIGVKAFAGNRSIKCAIMPSHLKTISSQAFADCVRLEEVLFSDQVSNLSNDAFIGSTRLHYLTYPNNIRKPIYTSRCKVMQSVTPTDYIYSPEWGYGHVDKRETNDIITVTFEDGSIRSLSGSYYQRKGKLIYLQESCHELGHCAVQKAAALNNAEILTTSKVESIEEDEGSSKDYCTFALKEHKTPQSAVTQYMTEEGFCLSDEQASVYEKLNTTNENYLITGKAGTGKSVLLRYFIEHTSKIAAVVAFTGIAALNANGQTINSLFQLDTKIQYTKDRKSVEKLSDPKKEVLRHLQALVIDEVSMVRADMLDMIDQKLRYAKKEENKPFGGCQIIAFGDLFQLPPFFSRDEHGSRYLFDTYHTLFYFGAPSIAQQPLKHIELNEVKRQTNPDFIRVLNAIRIGEISPSILQIINNRVQSPPEGLSCITLTPWNDTAKDINNTELAKLPGDEFQYDAAYTGTFVGDVTKGNDANLPTDIVLKLKVGARVMMVRNDYNHRWVNGTTAVITSLSDDAIEAQIKGIKYKIEPETWQKYEYKYDNDTKQLASTEVGTFTQFPVRLAYAITINKSQGQTYDNICINYAGRHAFAAGQTYVALSRCRSLEGIYLTSPITEQDIKVSTEAKKYMKQGMTDNRMNKAEKEEREPLPNIV